MTAGGAGESPGPAGLKLLTQDLRALRTWLLFNLLCFGGVGGATLGKSEQNMVRDVITLVGVSSLFSSNTARWVKVTVAQSCLTLCKAHGLYSPWNSLGQSGVGSLSLLQGILPTPVWPW